MIRPVAAALAAAACAATILLGAGPAAAHDDTSGAVVLTVSERRVLGTAPVAFAELGYRDTSGDGLLDADEIRAQEADVVAGLVTAVREHVALEVDGEESVIIGAGPAPVAEGTDVGDGASEYVEVLFMSGPHDGDVSEVDLSWSFTSPSDQVVLTGPDGSVTGRLGDDGTAAISLDAGATVRSFFASGVDHVRSGLDHLLFLVVLTIAVVGATVSGATAWRVVKLVTAFTLGHATSLCLAYFDVVSVPAAVVEPAISLSIVAAAVLALRGRGDAIRPWLATLVGLVHGLGFAGSLSGLGLATSHELGALAAFNLGIDVAQTAVVLLVVAAIWLSAKVFARRHHWVRVAVCGGAGLVGLGWTASLLAS